MKLLTLGAAGITGASLLFFAVQTFNANGLDGVAAVIGSEAKTVYAECISAFSDAPLQSFTISKEDLNDDGKVDALVAYTEGDACGSAGCIYELCVSKNGTYAHVPFGFAAKSITIEETMSNGMKDVILNNDEALQMSWDGTHYVLSSE
jgi:hypothetical protein